MARPKPLIASLAGSPDEIEAQLYEALQRGDLEGLLALWADEDEIVCVHPGGTRLIGPAAIRASFEALFANGGIRIQPEQVHRVQHVGLAVHHLVERIEVITEKGPQRAWVLATNVYLKTAQGWRLAAHHASPGTAHEPSTSGGDPPAILH